VSAVLKPNEQAALDVRLASRRADQFEIARTREGIEGLKDELQEMIDLHFDQMLANHAALDDLENATMFANCIASYALHLSRSRRAKEMRDEFLPSWRSSVDP
jgi:uncharacterized metal-binding protein YceD (DUF177 family)